MKDRYPTIRLCSILSLVLLCGCTTAYIVPSSNTLIKNRCYTYAIYNDQGRLLTHPLQDFKHQMRLATLAEAPYTDVYIVAHGWNYDLQESYTNYQMYIDQINEKQATECVDPSAYIGSEDAETTTRSSSIRPFFIFVTWPSATRPVTSLFSSILPFGLDTSLKPISLALDNLAFFLPTAWRQSINAKKIALGNRYPNKYLFDQWPTIPYGTGSLRERMGRDAPLSSLVYTLITKTHPHQRTEIRAQESKTEDFNIHLVGHSYGAKLAALAAVEGIRRWITYERYSNLIDPYMSKYEKCQHPITATKGTIDQYHKAFDACLTQRPLEERKLRKQILEHHASEPYDVQNQRDAYSHQSFLKSLILMNPAFHPTELNYLYDKTELQRYFFPLDSSGCRTSITPTSSNITCDTESIFKRIDRKAVVFSESDHANQWLYSFSQLILNNSWSQNMSAYMASNSQKQINTHLMVRRLLDMPLTDRYKPQNILSRIPTLFLNGAITLSTGIVSSPYYWLKMLGPIALGNSGLTSSQYSQSIFGNLLTSMDTDATFLPQQLMTPQPPESFCHLGTYTLPQKSLIPFKISNEVFYSFDASETFNRSFSNSLDFVAGSHNDLRSNDLTFCQPKQSQEKIIWTKLYEWQDSLTEPTVSTQELAALLDIPSPELTVTQHNTPIETPNTELGYQTRGDTQNEINAGLAPTRLRPVESPATDPLQRSLPNQIGTHYELNIHFPQGEVPIIMNQDAFDLFKRSINWNGQSSIVTKNSGYQLFTVTPFESESNHLKTVSRPSVNPTRKILNDILDDIPQEISHNIQQCEQTFNNLVKPMLTAREKIWRCITSQIMTEADVFGHTSLDREAFAQAALQSKVGATMYIQASDDPYDASPHWLTQQLLASEHHASFVELLRQASNPIGKFLQPRLLPSLKWNSDKFAALESGITPQIRKELHKQLIQLIEEESLYQQPEFSQIQMSPTTRKLWADIFYFGEDWRPDGHDLGGKDRMLLNRHLLVDAFPTHFSNQTLTHYGYWKHRGLSQYGPTLLTHLSQLLIHDISKICVIKKPKKQKKRDHTLNFVLNFSQFQCAEGQDCHSPLSNAFEAIDESELACYTEPSPASSSKVASVFTSAPSQEKYP